MKKVKVTKLAHSDDLFTKNQYAEPGYERIGYYIADPVVGQNFEIAPAEYKGLSTSAVQEILSENTFRTYNSIYKWEIIE